MNTERKDNTHIIICELNENCKYMQEPPANHWQRMEEKLRGEHPEIFLPKELRLPITAFEQTPDKNIYTQISKN